ncbi:MAG: threonylcarbamoyl-AMP synthase [Clostridiales bacterium]|nr:threonylcarbamoyl-AMP synthase [Clostridiales bacterium]
MKTTIKTITPESLAEAKNLIFGGEVVAMPTETVYGLGGNAFDDCAVQRIFAVKGRPADNPLIAHVHTGYDLSKIIDYDPPYAKKLREAFLPGPLTLVYPSTNKVSGYVSCGLDTLAVRVPSHTGAQAFLRAVDIPIVAPSANLSKHVSPTSAEHVYEDFNGKIPLILDGGVCEGGIESTVCDVTGEIPVVLRPGLITAEMIAAVVGDCGEYAPNLTVGEKVKSPGVLYKHYSPRCKTLLFENVTDGLTAIRKTNGERVAVLCEDEIAEVFANAGVTVLNLGKTEREMAARLYELLREAEKLCDVLITIEPKKKDGVMVGVLNRLRKACTSVDIKH